MIEILRDELDTLCGGRLPLVLVIFLLPLGFTIVFGIAYRDNVVNNIPLVVLDEDQSKISRQLIQMYDDADRFEIVHYATSQEEVDDAIKNSYAVAALEIPKNFSKNIRLQNGSEILFIVNSTNNMFGNSSVATVKEIQRSFNVSVAQKTLESKLLPSDAMNSAYPVQLGIRILGNPTNSYSPFMLMGLVLNGLQISVMLTFAPSLVTELSRRKFLNSSPIKIVVMKIIPHIICGTVSFAISLNVMEKLFDIPMHGSFFDVMILIIMFLFFLCGALSFFSACSPMIVMSLEMPLIYIMPGLLYSGISYPTFDMNEIAYTYSRLLPISHAAENLRDLSLLGYAPNLWNDIKFMSAGGILFLILATIIFELRRRRANNHVESDET